MKKISCTLLVDDDSTSNFLHELIVDQLGFTEYVATASNGEEALTFLKTYVKERGNCPDLILLDINMPVMNGFEFLQEYQKWELKNKDCVKIVILSTSQISRDVEFAKRFGVTDFITKPLTEKKLSVIVEKYFNNYV